MSNKKPLISIVIPVHNTGDLLYQTLDSVCSQNIDLKQIETIIIDDASNDKRTKEIIAELREKSSYKDLDLKVLQNETNLWVSESRNIAVKEASGKYLVLLDSDDILTPDYLSLSYVTLKSFPKASWVYPSVIKFGFRNCVDIAPNYSAKNLLVENYCVVTSMMKMELWEELKGHRFTKLSNGLHLHEDWDFWQRALKKGRFGVPLKKPVFKYRQRLRSNITRNDEESNVTTLLSIRKNWRAFFGVPRSQKLFKENDKHTERAGTLQRIFQKVARVFFNRSPKRIAIKDTFLYLVSPKLFAKKRLSSKTMKTKAHTMAGFISKFPYRPSKEIELQIPQKSDKKILVTHYFWHLGGAEKILLSYIEVLHKAGYEIIDVVVNGKDKGAEYKTDFGEYASRQYDLSEISDEHQYPKLNALWEIFKIENPTCVLNMSNPFTYLISEQIREFNPNISVVDLIHNEEFNDSGWFGAAESFQNFLTKRIVTSDFWKEVLIQKYGEPDEKVIVIKNPIDYTDKFIPRPKLREELRSFYKIPEGVMVIGFLGRIDVQKQPHLFIHLAKKLIYRDDLKFVMVGDGLLLKEYESQISGLSNLIHLPATSTPERMFNLFDVAVFPSLYEGYPMVGLETASLNIPMIAPSINGFREQVEDGNFGITYAPDNTLADVTRIIDIIENRLDELLSKGKNGRPFVNEHHNSEFLNAHILDTFNSFH